MLKHILDLLPTETLQLIDHPRTMDSNSYLLMSRVDIYVADGGIACKKVKDGVMTVIKDKNLRIKNREIYATVEVSPERRSSVMAAAKAYRWAEIFNIRAEVKIQYNPVRLFYVGNQGAPVARPTLLLTWTQDRGFIQDVERINDIVRGYSRERGAEALVEG